MRKPAGGLVSIREAAEEIGVKSKHPAQWLRRYLLAREEELGRTILVPVGKGKRRPTYRVSIARLRLVCPELFDARDQLERTLRGLATPIKKQLDELKDAVDEQGARLAILAESGRRR